MFNFIINPEEADQTIISFIKKRFKKTPLALIHKLFRTKKIKINEEDIRYYQHRLKKGDKVNIYDNSLKITKLSFLPPVKSEIDFEIIYEDQNLLIVLKEHGVPMRSMNDYCLDKAVNYYLYQQDAQEYQKLAESLFVFTAVHRLDKLTKGLVIYPKNSEAKRILYNSIKDKESITKSYLAICENYQAISFPSFIEGFIYKDEKKEKMVFSQQNPSFSNLEVRNCAMEIESLYKKGDYNLLKITLHTGRKHQIRAILTYLGTPVFGDEKYGSQHSLPDKIYLFAYQLFFAKLSHPLSYLEEKYFRLEGLEKELINKIKREKI